MKVLNFKENDLTKFGVMTEQGILDVVRAAVSFEHRTHSEKTFPQSLESLLLNGDEGMAALTLLVEASTDLELWISPKDICYGPAVTNPEKIICIGLNYASHTGECQMEMPKDPVVFSKFNNALAAHREGIRVPKNTSQMDYEAELVVVIGKEGKDIPLEEALDHVFGYTVGNDLSARDLQFKTAQWLIGKSGDQFAPLGPCVTTKEGVDPNNLEITCQVNGEIRQKANTRDMIFNCAQIISYLSSLMTLKPGDVIFTGTPSGVMLGYPEAQQKWLQSGDCMTIEIEGLGILENKLL